MDLSKDQAVAAINKLMEDGLITEEQVSRAIIDSPPPEVCMTVDTLHTFFCPKGHTGDAGCEYYQEERMEGTWQRPGHRHWSERAVSIINENQLDGFTELKEIMRMVLDLYNRASMLKHSDVILLLLASAAGRRSDTTLAKELPKG